MDPSAVPGPGPERSGAGQGENIVGYAISNEPDKGAIGHKTVDGSRSNTVSCAKPDGRAQ